MTKPISLSEWAKLLAQQYVRYPEALEVTENEAGIILRGHRADYGKLVGQAGKNIVALKIILSAIANHNVSVDVLESNTGESEEPARFEPDRHWSKRKQEVIHDLLSRVCGAMFHESQVLLSNKFHDECRFIIWADGLNLELEHALFTIFRAIGNTRGRKVSVESRPRIET